MQRQLLASLALVLAASGLPLDTLNWTKCGSYNCSHLYFCCDTGNKLFGYGFKASATAPCNPGAAPVIRFLPGGKYNLTIHNTCPPKYNPVTKMNDTATNLHVHGSHTSGEGNNDNVLRQLDPGYCMMQNYIIPSDHNVGTNWYHPHLHMNVLPQVAGGAFGLSIVDGAPTGTYDANVKKFYTNPTIEKLFAVTSLGMANGEIGIEVPLVMNQWYYFRILHVIPTGTASQPSFFHPAFVKNCVAYELAADGVCFSTVPYQKFGSPVYNFTVHSAQRLDLAVKCSVNGTYGGYTFGANRVLDFKVSPGPVGPETPFTNSNQQWTPTRPNYLADLRNGKYPAVVTTVGAITPINMMDNMTINGMSWNVKIPTASFPFGDKYIQQFNVINADIHVWHMHQQRFQVVQTGGCPPVHKEGEWYDSITVPSAKDCLVRARFVDYSGKIIHHCHDLDHEDDGMMGWFNVPFAAPGSFEASPLYQPQTPEFKC